MKKFLNKKEILIILGELFRTRKGDSPIDFCDFPFARFSVVRVCYGENLYIESVKIKTGKFYLVGTLQIKNTINEAQLWKISSSEIITPVRSKVVEYLSIRNPKLTQELTQSGVIPTVGYYTGGLWDDNPLLFSEKTREETKPGEPSTAYANWIWKKEVSIIL